MSGDLMTLRHLKIFLTVCEQGSMTGAAQVLHVSQPPISQAVKELEHHYGTRLFERLGRGIALSPAGADLRSYAAHLLALAAEAEVVLASRELNGPLRIGASMTVGAVLLPDLLRDYSIGHPGVRFSVTIANSGEILRGIADASLDLGFIEGHSTAGEALSYPLMDDELVLITKPGKFSPFAQPIPLSRLQGEGFYIRESGSGTREIFDAAMENSGIRYFTAGVINEPSAIIRLVSMGMGMAFLSRLRVRQAAESGLVEVVAVSGLAMARQISLVHHRIKYFSPALTAFKAKALGYWTAQS